jgi:hypothetical protein
MCLVGIKSWVWPPVPHIQKKIMIREDVLKKVNHGIAEERDQFAK